MWLWATSTVPRRWDGTPSATQAVPSNIPSPRPFSTKPPSITLGEKGSVRFEAAPLTPRHDLRELRGSYMELTDRRAYDGTPTDDYLHITLTDEQDVPDALARLRVIYPNLMRLDYDNRRTRAAETPDAAARAESKTPLEHFAAFYEAQNGQPLSDEQAAFCQSLIEDIWKEDEA